MKIKLENKPLIDEYIVALTTVERILWQEKMGRPPKYLENYNPGCFFETLFLVLFLIISYQISNGGIFFTLFCLSAPSSLFLIHYYQKEKETKLDIARSHTQYLITNKRIIFMVYQNETINIQSIPYDEIKRVYSSKLLGENANIYLLLHKPANFQTFKYWSQKPHEKIVMVQVEEHQNALNLIQEHIF
ncbi:MAG: PH domain-containing protein [Aureispira sp.]|nr:PH domain-containing protein [Aureispira sp.]